MNASSLTSARMAATAAGIAAPARAQVVASALAVGGLGLALLWGVGFSNIDAVHDAAHDTRHSTGFPCH